MKGRQCSGLCWTREGEINQSISVWMIDRGKRNRKFDNKINQHRWRRWWEEMRWGGGGRGRKCVCSATISYLPRVSVSTYPHLNQSLPLWSRYVVVCSAASPLLLWLARPALLAKSMLLLLFVFRGPLFHYYRRSERSLLCTNSTVLVSRKLLAPNRRN